MSSSMSPEHSGGMAHSYASDDQDRGQSSSVNLGILKNLTEKRTTREGNPPKRRGPKPDSKPALTRRQELNRQAQRTHRERKELYIKALEDEVLRLKEIYSSISQDKDKLADENRTLKDTLARNGIPLDDVVSSTGIGASSVAGTSPTSHTPGSRSALSPPITALSTAPSTTSNSEIPSHGQPVSAGNQLRDMTQQVSGQTGLDFEQAGIDFVLALERPCMAHMPFLLDRAAENDGEPCGHALMATCPPKPFQNLTPNTPFGCNTCTGLEGEGPQTWKLNKVNLSTLMDLSKRLNLDGEITPVMAWGMILAHPHFRGFKPEDFQKLAGELGSKVRCYGFGAVMEEFEIRDAVENVLSSKT